MASRNGSHFEMGSALGVRDRGLVRNTRVPAMIDDREEFLNGVLAFSRAMRSVGLNPQDVTVVLSEKDGRTMEHILTQRAHILLLELVDDRFSSAAADNHIREFRVAGVKFQYRCRPFMLPSGKVV